MISLDLSNMKLRGTVAREIGNLTFLTSLDISNNNLSGPIPAEIGKLRRLRVLDMSLNQLNHPIPQSLGLLRGLELLNIGNNYLSGIYQLAYPHVPFSLYLTCLTTISLEAFHQDLETSRGFSNFY